MLNRPRSEFAPDSFTEEQKAEYNANPAQVGLVESTRDDLLSLPVHTFPTSDMTPEQVEEELNKPASTDLVLFAYNDLQQQIGKGKYSISHSGITLFGDYPQELVDNAPAGAVLTLYTHYYPTKFVVRKSLTINTNGFDISSFWDCDDRANPGEGENKLIIVSGGGRISGFFCCQETTTAIIDVITDQNMPNAVGFVFHGKELTITRKIKFITWGIGLFSGNAKVTLFQGAEGVTNSRPIILGGGLVLDPTKRVFTGSITIHGKVTTSYNQGIIIIDNAYGAATGTINLAGDFYGENTHATGYLIDSTGGNTSAKIIVQGNATLNAKAGIFRTYGNQPLSIDIIGKLRYTGNIPNHISLNKFTTEDDNTTVATYADMLNAAYGASRKEILVLNDENKSLQYTTYTYWPNGLIKYENGAVERLPNS